jgi:HSP20 family protein
MIMALLRYEPWNRVERWHRQIEQILGDTLSTPTNGEGAAEWVPSVDVHEEPEQFVVQADLPGVESKDINVTADQGVLTISGQRRSEQREKHKGFSRVERVAGSFVRRFTLPDNVRTDDIRAQHVNGVLQVTIPKAQAPEPKRVAIEAH